MHMALTIGCAHTMYIMEDFREEVLKSTHFVKKYGWLLYRGKGLRSFHRERERGFHRDLQGFEEFEQRVKEEQGILSGENSLRNGPEA